MGWYSWRPYVSVAARRRHAAKRVAKMKKAGREISPIEIVGRKIATTFWGDAWCKNLESYSDYSNRLPRGRTYVHNGSVIDLQIEAGRVRSLVSGSDIYEVDTQIKSLAKKRWTDIKGQCAGKIDSLVELLHFQSNSLARVAIVTRVALSVRRGACLRSTKNVSCFRRKRFSAARALRERHRLRANAMASRTIDRIFENSRTSEPLHVPKTPVASSGQPARSSRAWQV